MSNYKYIGGAFKVSIAIESYPSFKYPSDSFKPVSLPLISIGYEYLGKRKQVKTRFKKQLQKILSDLHVDLLQVNEFMTQQGMHL